MGFGKYQNCQVKKVTLTLKGDTRAVINVRTVLLAILMSELSY